jgi:hypothetical protein
MCRTADTQFKLYLIWYWLYITSLSTLVYASTWSMLFSFNQELCGRGEAHSLRGFPPQTAKGASPCDRLSNRPRSSQASVAWEPETASPIYPHMSTLSLQPDWKVYNYTKRVGSAPLLDRSELSLEPLYRAVMTSCGACSGSYNTMLLSADSHGLISRQNNFQRDNLTPSARWSTTNAPQTTRQELPWLGDT